MIHYIKGNLAMKFAGGVVVETGGIGYEIFVPDNSSVYLAREGEAVSVFTAMIVREDDISIYGFGKKEALDLFRKLMTVSGIGAKAAIAVLSAMPISELKKAIVFGDAVSLTRANGIGKKSAERIILELKDKLGAMGDMTAETAAVSFGGGRSEAADALMGLGYSRSEAMSAIASVTKDNLTTEEYIKQALKKM